MKRKKLKHQLSILLVTTLLINANSSFAEIEDNQSYREAYQAWAASHLALLPTSFLPGPLGSAADLLSIGIDVRIKTLPASLVAPTPNAVTPNNISGCQYVFDLPQKEATYENLLGLADIQPLTTNWGAFSNPNPPEVEHANAQVAVRVANQYLDDWSRSNRRVVFPSGNHPLKWSANTQIDLLIDVTIPVALFIITNEVKYFKSFFSLQTDPATARRAAEIGGLFLINAGIEAGVITAGQVDSNIPIDSATHEQVRPFTVLDISTPTITTTMPNPAPLEANSLGGEQWQLHEAGFKATINASDPCNQSLLVGNDAPFLLPLGTTQVTWEAVDTRPLGPGNSGRATVVQNITVEDTRPPIILVPPSRVIESNTAATTDDFDIGTAVVFDVADPDPLVTNTVGNSFPPNTRTEVLWTATDSSGNSDSHSQWITVKTPGTNTAPSVSNTNASGLTSEMIDIELIGIDNDEISGIFDPLKFDITAPPENGFFVSPLVPYFIEDFRVRPDGAAGTIINTSDNPANALYEAYCNANPPAPLPTDFVYQAEFVHVTDDNTFYVLDEYWQCDTGNSSAVTKDRLSKWNANGEFQDQIDVNQSIKRITLDADGFIYTVRPASSSDALFLNKHDDQLNFIQSWKLDGVSGNPRLLGATMDSATGLIFATEKRKIYVFDGADGQFVPEFLGTLKNNESFLSGAPSIAGSSSRGFYIEIDSTGSLYVVDSGLNRIHKFEPTSYDGVTLNTGDHVGWMGRCDSGPGCDDINGRSFGYSCNDNTPCQVANSTGSGPGQFDTPIGIALDPNNILYVTDYENSRVQRFTDLGDFAGEAASTCDGTCFILGDMGMPLDISVNSSKFYVLDDERALMHIFETAPFKEITDNSVVVTYASDNNFQGVDSFSYVANDGLVDSNTGTATISISRNFRAPEALANDFSTNEDVALSFSLPASDPDGILGVDFNGLDTLTYEIVQTPQHGTLSGSGVNRIYTPDENFNGSDSFKFKVSDGLFDSNEATITLQVNAVNDVPEVAFTDADSRLLPKQLWPLLEGKIAGENIQAGLGYPLPLMAEYFDPDANQAHFLQINWGDGSVDNGDQNPPEDPQNPDDEPIITKTFRGLGQIYADHIYTSISNPSISIIVTDDQGATSQAALATIEVIPMVDITIVEELVEPENLPEPGEMTELVIHISNQAPSEPIIGINATNVEFTGELPQEVQLLNIQTSQGSCQQTNQSISCQFGTLEPEDVVTLTLSLLPDINFDPSQEGLVANASSAQPDASYDNLKVIEIPVQFNDEIFANGFEANE